MMIRCLFCNQLMTNVLFFCDTDCFNAYKAVRILAGDHRKWTAEGITPGGYAMRTKWHR